MRRADPSCLAVLLAGLTSGCINVGDDPPPATLNFPIAVEIAPDADGAPRWLAVVNSNFDLLYNTGTLQVFDLDAIEAAVGRCQEDGDDACVLSDPSDFLPTETSEVGIGTHADGLVVSPQRDRFYLPVRSDRDLTFIDFDPATGALACDQELRDSDNDPDSDVRRCADSFRAGHDGSITSERELVLDGDPVAVASASLESIGGEADSGDFVLLALRNGEIALFIDQVTAQGRRPELVHTADGFEESLMTLTLEPGTGTGWMTSATSDNVARVGILVDRANPSRSFLFDAGDRSLAGVDDGEDVRDIQFHPSRSRAYALSRQPEAVIALDLERESRTPGGLAIDEIYEVASGPSRLAVAELGGRTYLFASCFQAQQLFVIDDDHGELISVVGGFSGPFEITVDPVRNLLYAADFSTSVVRIVDLGPLLSDGIPSIIATLGEPRAVQSLTGGST